MNEFKYLTECMTRDLIEMLMARKSMSLKEAFDALYTSETFEKLQDCRSGLYFQSPGYVYSFLEEELLTGKMG
jgi:hypothetical protein